MYSVIIIEDDPMVVEINRQYAEYNGKLRVDANFSNGEAALDYLDRNSVDLILLDYHLPDMNGLELLRKLRAGDHFEDIIMITAVNDSLSIGLLYRLGICDYLVKPFEHARFQSAIKRFVLRRELLGTHDTLTQSEIDGAFANPPDFAPARQGYMDKGIQPSTLDMVCAFLRKHREENLTIELLAENLSLSRVTLRRYMNYLISKNIVISSMDYHTGGRPSAIYNYIGK